MGQLNQLSVQMIMLIATLPLRLEKKLWSRMSWDPARVRSFRDRTSRINIQYRTVMVDDTQDRVEA